MKKRRLIANISHSWLKTKFEYNSYYKYKNTSIKMNKEVKEKEKNSFLTDRLLVLKKLKDKYDLTNKWIKWKKKANMKEITSPIDENDFRTQVSATVKRQKDAELWASVPEFSFIPLDDEAEPNRKIVKEVWKYHWMNSKTDKAIKKTIRSATTYWTWILEEWIEHIVRKIKEPVIDWEWISFKEVVQKESVISSKRIPFLNFFINWTDIDNSTEAMTIEVFNKKQFCDERINNPIYSNIEKVLESTKTYPIWEIDWFTKTTLTDEEEVTVVRRFDIAEDSYIIEANWIEILNTVIPYSHKKLPFCLFIDNDAEDRIWWIWEFELLEEDEKAKNEYRSLTIKATKASIWFILKDAWNDLESSDLEYWVQQVYDTNDIQWVQHFAPNVPLQAIAQLEEKVDNDIIVKSWVDFKSLLLAPEESATRTASKSQSSKKRINDCIKDNAYEFWRRLWELRMSNIQQLHSMKPIRISIEWWSITNEWVFISDETWGYWWATIWANFVRWSFRILPIVETMLWDSDQRKKDNLANFMQLTWNITDESWRPVVKWVQLVKLASQEYWYDYEKLTEEVTDVQSSANIVNKIFNEEQISVNNDPNYIPPEQRSWANMQVPTISWQAKIPYEA